MAPEPARSLRAAEDEPEPLGGHGPRADPYEPEPLGRQAVPNQLERQRHRNPGR